MAYSDEPVLVAPARRWSPKTLVIVVLVLAVVGGFLAIPIYQHVLDERAHAVRRGPHHGALYNLTLNGTPHTIELGWIAPAFSAVLTPAPAPTATLEVSGDFGRETLSWNAVDNRFGPGKFKLDPYAHTEVQLTLRDGDHVLWTGTLWLYGVPADHDH